MVEQWIVVPLVRVRFPLFTPSLCSSVDRVFVYGTKGRKFESCQRRVISLSSTAEQRAVNSKVVGSNPAGRAKSIIHDTIINDTLLASLAQW